MKLKWDLVVKNLTKPKKIEVSKLLEKWTSSQDVAKGKFFEIGTSNTVHETENKGWDGKGTSG